ncbi:MAG: VWA domain-containing protein, partial [Nanoarchaeota archaeon]
MAFIIPDYSNIYCASKYCVRYSYVLIAIIPILLFLFWLTRKTFVKFNNKFELENYVKSKKTDRKIVFALRSLAFVFLLIAIASPFMLESKTVPGNPRLTILVDNSTSMALYNSNIAYDLYKKLEGTVPVQIRTIAGGEHSTIGNGILNSIEGDDNVLVVTDGVNNEGKMLGDIMLFASGINSSISTLKMDAVKNDVGVTIDGPPELIKDTEGDFVVRVSVVGSSIPYTLQVSMDDSALILEEQGSGSKTFAFSKIFPEGEYHKLTARLLNVGGDDYFPNNNVYYKSVKIVPRPKILYLTQKTSPLAEQLFKIYEVDVRDSLPSDLSDYMAVIFNDIPASSINSRIDGLSSYVSDGNGLIFLGGEHSFDRGGYKGTLLETLLPVKIGASEESNKSDINIALVIDISSSTSESIGLEKALAISVVDSLSEKNNIGAVAFGNGHTERCQAFDILPGGLKPLKEVKKELKDRISRLDFDGQSCFDVGIQGGAQLLSKAGGGKNIIFISDGKTTYNQLRQTTLDIVRSVNAQGVKVFTVGVGTDMEDSSSDNDLFLDNMARVGEGIYFKADASNKLKVQFGDKDETKGEEFYNTLIPIDTSHFITLAMDEMHATISG